MNKSSKVLNKLIIGLTGVVCYSLFSPPEWRCDHTTSLSGGAKCIWDANHSKTTPFWNRNLFSPRTTIPTKSEPSSVQNAKKNHIDVIATRVARAHGIDPHLVKAIIKVESNYKPTAVSPAGAGGLMQLTAATAKHLGVKDRFDPHQNIHGGTRYLKQLLKEFNGDKQLALAAYNAGPYAVKRHGGIPPYKQTQEYVKKVMYTYRALSAQQTA